MNRLARSSIAFTTIIALTVTVLTGTMSAEAAPAQFLPANSVDVSTSHIDCDTAPTPSRDRVGLTLTTSANTANLTIAAIAQRASDTDGLLHDTPPVRAAWKHACASRAPHAPASLAA